MNLHTLKHSIVVVCAMVAGLLTVTSCGQDANEVSEKETAELQKQLDSTMQLYQAVKSQNADFDRQLASRDSAINAQASEIQRLINQLNRKQNQPAATASAVDQKQVERQQKEIREKESTSRNRLTSRPSKSRSCSRRLQVVLHPLTTEPSTRVR